MPAFNGYANARYSGISALNQASGFAGFLCPGDEATNSTLSLNSARVNYVRSAGASSFSCTINEYNTAGSSWQGSLIYACDTAGGCANNATPGTGTRGYIDWSGTELPPSLTSLMSYNVACTVPNVATGPVYSGIEGYYFNHANE